MISLKKIAQENEQAYKTSDQISYIESQYKLYSFELEELMQIAQENDSKIISITTPINLETPPSKVCPSSTNQKIKKEIAKASRLLKKGKMKVAENILEKLFKTTYANAELHYLYGVLLIRTGKRTLGLNHLNKAAIFDCSLWRAHKIFNLINLKTSNRYSHFIIDFHSELEELTGNYLIFLDEFEPQTIYTHQLVNKISDIIIKVLNL